VSVGDDLVAIGQHPNAVVHLLFLSGFEALGLRKKPGQLPGLFEK
jgi:hypothetical protein